jgi:hypothetical protein
MADAAQAQNPQAGQSVTVQYGPYKATVPMAGKSVKQIREELTARWSIDANAKGFLGKQEIADDQVITAGQTLTLFRVMGEKG